MSAVLQKIQIPPSMTSSKFRTVMARLMASRGINASELARRINVPQPTVHRLMTGKTEDPKLSTLLSIADYFCVTLDQLLGNAIISQIGDSDPIPRTMSAPILSWETALHARKNTSHLTSINWTDWIVLDMQASPDTFGLRSKPSMEPRFSVGSILVVDPNEKPQDGNMIIVHYPDTQEATVREMILDGPTKRLRSITDERDTNELTHAIEIIGVVIQTRYTYT